MESHAKSVIVVSVILIILMLLAGIYFGFIYEPKNAYDVAWDIEESISKEVKEVEEKIVDEPKENKEEGDKKKPTVKEIIREIEKNKPRFNLTIEPNIVVEYKDYTELKEASLETVVGKLKPDGEIHPMTMKLTEEDIKRLQEYDAPKIGLYIGFNDYDNESAEYWIKSINPISFPTYKSAKVEWLTDPRLVYKTAIGQRGIRGVLKIQYFEEENRFKVEPNKVYELDTEIIVSETANYDNSISLKLNEILYLSNLKEVE